MTVSDRLPDTFLATVASKGATAVGDFMHRQASDFRLRARRNKLLAQWAAPKLGRDPVEYLRYVIDADFTDGDKDDAIITMLLNDFGKYGIAVDEAGIRSHVGRFAAQARMEDDPRHPLSQQPREA